ncbi:unnamed protein product [Rotaria sp. Silwood2]|nr:unnamed protein product [Rotaria sp. Silwood2]
MIIRILLFICVILTIDSTDTIIDKLRIELELSKTAKKDPIIPFLCNILLSQEFIKAADDEDFLSLLLYELGFGVLGVKPNSWAAKFRGDPHKPASCFSALHSTATTEITKSTLASSRRIISRCCNSNKDL